jgi:hypothetical protein
MSHHPRGFPVPHFRLPSICSTVQSHSTQPSLPYILASLTKCLAALVTTTSALAQLKALQAPLQGKNPLEPVNKTVYSHDFGMFYLVGYSDAV